MAMSILQLRVGGTPTAYYAIVPNTQIRYIFAGNGLEEQFTSVRNLANLMQQGQQALTEGITQLLGDNTPAAEMINNLYQNQDELDYMGRMVYYSFNDDVVLWDVLEDAAMALLGAL